jgi:hypothetical protein
LQKKIYHLPDADKATGTAVILCSGGGLMSHSWGSDVINMARWLNERGNTSGTWRESFYRWLQFNKF